MKKVPISFRIDEEVMKLLKSVSDKNYRSMASQALLYIEEWLKSEHSTTSIN